MHEVQTNEPMTLRHFTRTIHSTALDLNAWLVRNTGPWSPADVAAFLQAAEMLAGQARKVQALSDPEYRA